MTNPFFTIGHSTRSLDEYAALLNSADVGLVADVRTVPRSRSNPQYNSDVLPKFLSTLKIEYVHLAAFGGLRGKQLEVSPATNAFWQNASFHNYADYAMGGEFHACFSKLRKLGHSHRCAIMCAETLWWRCHRRIIADYLIAAGETVFHILGPGQVNQAHLTSAAKSGSAGILEYPAAV
jgi:uncharacterized protein (DUF488 family)